MIEFQLTRSVGSVTLEELMKDIPADISTHTLRGERDLIQLLPAEEI